MREREIRQWGGGCTEVIAKWIPFGSLISFFTLFSLILFINFYLYQWPSHYINRETHGSTDHVTDLSVWRLKIIKASGSSYHFTALSCNNNGVYFNLLTHQNRYIVLVLTSKQIHSYSHPHTFLLIIVLQVVFPPLCSVCVFTLLLWPNVYLLQWSTDAEHT